MVMVDAKKAFIGREFNALWDSKHKQILKYNLLANNPLLLDFNRKEHTLVFGKSGSGKSYLLRVIGEELVRTMENYAAVVLDPMGIFNTFKMPNKNTAELDAWNAQINEVRAEGMPQSEVWVPAGDAKLFTGEGAYDAQFALQAPDFSYGTLCFAFEMDPLEPQVNLYRKAQKKLLKETQGNYLLEDLVRVVRDEGEGMGFKSQTIEALVTRLDALDELGIIRPNGVPINQIVREGRAAIVDLSMSSTYTARILVNFFAEQLLQLRKQVTRLVTRARVQETKIPKPPWYVPPTQLVIDEAHNYLPKNPVLRSCIKEGRNHGFMLTLVSQSPDLTRDVYANITNLLVGQQVYDDDIMAVKAMLPFEKAPKDFRVQVKDLTPGCFLYYNITNKTEQCIRVRPTKTLHPASTELLDERRYFIGEDAPDDDGDTSPDPEIPANLIPATPVIPAPEPPEPRPVKHPAKHQGCNEGQFAWDTPEHAREFLAARDRNNEAKMEELTAKYRVKADKAERAFCPDCAQEMVSRWVDPRTKKYRYWVHADESDDERGDPEPRASPVTPATAPAPKTPESQPVPKPVKTKTTKLAPISFPQGLPRRLGSSFSLCIPGHNGYEPNQVRPLVLQGAGRIGEVQVAHVNYHRLGDLPTDYLTYHTGKPTREEAISLLTTLYNAPVTPDAVWTTLACMWMQGSFNQPDNTPKQENA